MDNRTVIAIAVLAAGYATFAFLVVTAYRRAGHAKPDHSRHLE